MPGRGLALCGLSGTFWRWFNISQRICAPAACDVDQCFSSTPGPKAQWVTWITRSVILTLLYEFYPGGLDALGKGTVISAILGVHSQAGQAHAQRTCQIQ